MKALQNKTAIITGGSRGIGAAAAKHLAADGANVVVNYATSEAAAREVVAAIEAAGGRAIAAPGDVGRAADVTRLFDAAEAAFGPASILVNNAAIHETRHLEKIDEEHYTKIFNTNVLGTLLFTAEFARRFKGEWGRVVNVSSGAARTGLPGSSLYSASKGALEALTRVHAVELGSRGVTVNAVAPGPTETEMFKKGVPEEMKERMMSATILGRLGQPEDIASVIAFLCSDAGGWITGQFIDANGGRKL